MELFRPSNKISATYHSLCLSDKRPLTLPLSKSRLFATLAHREELTP
jgi:hypothetical protein